MFSVSVNDIIDDNDQRALRRQVRSYFPDINSLVKLLRNATCYFPQSGIDFVHSDLEVCQKIRSPKQLRVTLAYLPQHKRRLERRQHCQKCGAEKQVYLLQQRPPCQSTRPFVRPLITYVPFSRIQAAATGTGNESEKEAEGPGPSTPVNTKQEKRALSQATVLTQAILDSLEYDTMGESWLVALESEFKKPYFVNVSSVFVLAIVI